MLRSSTGHVESSIESVAIAPELFVWVIEEEVVELKLEEVETLGLEDEETWDTEVVKALDEELVLKLELEVEDVVTREEVVFVVVVEVD